VLRARDDLGVEEAAEAIAEGPWVSVAADGEEQLPAGDEPVLSEEFEDRRVVGLNFDVGDAAGRQPPRFVAAPRPTLRKNSSWNDGA